MSYLPKVHSTPDAATLRTKPLICATLGDTHPNLSSQLTQSVGNLGCLNTMQMKSWCVVLWWPWPHHMLGTALW
jgi:hypothetical protein